MIKARYDQELGAVIIEFSGKVDKAQAEQSYVELQSIVPKHGKGFKLLTDLSRVEKIDLDIRDTIKKTMDFLDSRGVTEIFRVIADPEQDIGFNIMSLFHYSKRVKFFTLESRQEAEESINVGRKIR